MSPSETSRARQSENIGAGWPEVNGLKVQRTVHKCRSRNCVIYSRTGKKFRDYGSLVQQVQSSGYFSLTKHS